MDDDGQNAHKLLDGDEDTGLADLTWSPDGMRLAYIKDHNSSGTNESSIESIDLQMNRPATLVASGFLKDLASLPPELHGLVWLSDGRFIYSTGVRIHVDSAAIIGNCGSTRIRDCPSRGRSR